MSVLPGDDIVVPLLCPVLTVQQHRNGKDGDDAGNGYIFGKGGAARMAEQFELPFLGEIPLVQSIREGGDNGIPAVIDDASPAREKFLELAGTVAQRVSIRNAGMEPTKVMEIN